MTCWHDAPEIFPSRFLSCQHIWMVNCCQSFLSLLVLEMFYHSKWCVNTRRGLFDFKSCCQNLRKIPHLLPLLHSKMCFACCYFTWMFAGWCMSLTLEDCFHIHWLKGENFSELTSVLDINIFTFCDVTARWKPVIVQYSTYECMMWKLETLVHIYWGVFTIFYFLSVTQPTVTSPIGLRTTVFKVSSLASQLSPSCFYRSQERPHLVQMATLWRISSRWYRLVNHKVATL